MERERGNAIMCVRVRACARAYEWDRERSADGYRREWEREGEREKTSARATRAQEDERRRHAACLEDSGKFFCFFFFTPQTPFRPISTLATRARGYTCARLDRRQASTSRALFFFFFSRVRGPPQSWQGYRRDAAWQFHGRSSCWCCLSIVLESGLGKSPRLPFWIHSARFTPNHHGTDRNQVRIRTYRRLFLFLFFTCMNYWTCATLGDL